MSSDEECDDGFSTHQPSWQSDKFKIYKQKLDIKYLTVCSKRAELCYRDESWELREKEVSELKENDLWIVNFENNDSA